MSKDEANAWKVILFRLGYGANDLDKEILAVFPVIDREISQSRFVVKIDNLVLFERCVVISCATVSP